MNDYALLTAADTMRIERLLPGPIERVWSYLVDPELRGRWLAAGPVELEVGGRVEHVFRNSELTVDDDPPPGKYAQYACGSVMHGQVTACQPPHLLSYTWSEDCGTPSEVRFELSQEGAKVRMVLTHRRLGNRDVLLSVAAGWHTHLGILAARLEGRDPDGFWRTHTRLEAEYEERLPAERSDA